MVLRKTVFVKFCCCTFTTLVFVALYLVFNVVVVTPALLHYYLYEFITSARLLYLLLL